MTNTSINNNQYTPETPVSNSVKVRHFLPLISSAGAVIFFTLGHLDVFLLLGFAMMLTGVISALTVCPGKMLGFPIICIAGGFKLCRAFIPFYGLADIMAGILGLVFGGAFGLAVVIFAPAIFSIAKWNERCEVEA